MVGEGGSGGGDRGAGPSRPYDELLKELFVVRAGLSVEDAERVVPLLQTLIDASKLEAEKAAAAAIAREKEEKRKRKEAKRSNVDAEEALSPRKRERKLRREAREAEKARVEELRRKEAERAQRPELALSSGGSPLPRSYNLFRSQFKQVVRANLGPLDYWGKKEAEKFRIREQIKERFKNGAYIDDKFLNKRISASLSHVQNHQREKFRKYLAERPIDAEVVREQGCPDVLSPDEWAAWLEDELAVRAWQKVEQFELEISLAEQKRKVGEDVDILPLKQKLEEWQKQAKILGDPPAAIVAALERVQERPAVTHRMGQGGSNRLKAEFVSGPLPPPQLLP